MAWGESSQAALTGQNKMGLWELTLLQALSGQTLAYHGNNLPVQLSHYCLAIPHKGG